MIRTKIGFMGAGKMATALAESFVRADLVPGEQIFAFDPSKPAAKAFAKATGGQIVESPEGLASQVDALFLAVKPQVLPAALSQLAIALVPKQLVISIVAGVRLEQLAKGLLDDARLVRVMPNTPALVGAGASGYCLGKNTTAADAKLVQKLLDATGIAYEVNQQQLDAVTGLAGSGPAYVYAMIEALADGGVLAGLPRDMAMSLAAQTLRGAAEMVLQTGEHPGRLKDNVASPGGTTIHGLREIENGGLRATLIAAVEAATLRSEELGRMSDS